MMSIISSVMMSSYDTVDGLQTDRHSNVACHQQQVLCTVLPGIKENVQPPRNVEQNETKTWAGKGVLSRLFKPIHSTRRMRYFAPLHGQDLIAFPAEHGPSCLLEVDP